MTTRRLDAVLVERGLARSRAAAVELISSGKVAVDDRPIVKPSTSIADEARISVTGADHYVSRGAHKLVAALDAFDCDVSDQLVLDVGASTGGFTQVLLERGAREVIALDVGHDQLASSLRSDSRVRVVEGFNVRDLSRDALAEHAGTGEPPSVIVGDLSFISLRYVLDPLRQTGTDDADVILLIKPQFEVGRTGVREGIVRDPARRIDAVQSVLWSAWDAGLGVCGLERSPVVGTHGNSEYLVHMHAQHGSNPTEWMRRAEQLAGGDE
ncbi:TlyA family RNA methyltransferase [Paramicrobacterium agarici]|uniref:TlyA family RNA methyltransferase n=1 Tax=Paramicrobacterium agarici TaxID=630514 RepID=UPI00114FAAF0|nr:TlyA family RNA methyltransferase [Microbacterium agarici]TQO24145.1 23S rRNA (cytidine1920-2'-O)/16S rRNA (cytidine1409-2'-O)-methyltransferase [Microbacterium agarici]